MYCPNCEAKLKDVVVKSHYGATIELNQCPNCGGIWCDKLEIYGISPEEAHGIEKLDVKKLEEFKLIKKELICPRCKNALIEFKDPHFPRQINLEHCFKCGGFWLNRGELVQFKEWQKIKSKKSRKEILEKNREFSKQIERLFDLERKGTLEIWGEAGRFLSQPVKLGRPSIGLQSEESTKVVAYIFIIIQIISLIARRLLRIPF